MIHKDMYKIKSTNFYPELVMDKYFKTIIGFFVVGHSKSVIVFQGGATLCL